MASVRNRSMPRAVAVTGAALLLLAAGGLAAGGLEQPAFPLYCAVVALVPLRGRSGMREWGALLGYALAAWSAFGLAPFVTIREALGGPYGGHPLLFATGLVLAVLRIRALT